MEVTTQGWIGAPHADRFTSNVPGYFALSEQLVLMAESREGQADALAIDYMERPSEN